jgi:hypothetical protein
LTSKPQKKEKKNKKEKTENNLFSLNFEDPHDWFFFLQIRVLMSVYKFTGKKTQSKEKISEVSWTTAGDKVGAYLPPGQRKQTVEEAFPELKGNGLVSLKRSTVPCESKPLPLTFADKLKATTDAEKNSMSVGNNVIEDNDIFVMPSRKTVVLTDREIRDNRRLYPSSEEENDKQGLQDEPEEDDSFEYISDGENDNLEVYDPSEYDRH